MSQKQDQEIENLLSTLITNYKGPSAPFETAPVLKDNIIYQGS